MLNTLTSIRRPRWAALCALLLGSLALNACTAQTPERLGAPIEGYSHTSAAINWFSVNGAGGPNISPNSGGGKQNCCVSLPVKWQPGLKVVVEWEKDPNPTASRNWPSQNNWEARQKAITEHRSQYTRHRAVVEVAPYDRLGAVDVHFLPCNQVKVSAVNALPGQPGYPYNYPLNMEEPSQCTNP